MNDTVGNDDKDDSRSSFCQRTGENLLSPLNADFLHLREKCTKEKKMAQGRRTVEMDWGQGDTCDETQSNRPITSGPVSVGQNGEGVINTCKETNAELQEAIQSLGDLNRRIESFRQSSIWKNNPAIRKEILVFTERKVPSVEEGTFRRIAASENDKSGGSTSSDRCLLKTHDNNSNRSAGSDGTTGKKQDITLESGIQIIQDLLLDTQHQCSKMVNDNQRTATRFDNELSQCQSQMDALRKELAYANRCVSDLEVNAMITGSATESDTEMHNAEHQMEAEIHRLREDNARMRMQLRALQHDLLAQRQAMVDPNANDANSVDQTNSPSQRPLDHPRQPNDRHSVNSLDTNCSATENNNNRAESSRADGTESSSFTDLQLELIHAKDALIALKHDRKRLKAEKVELLNQMKEVYQTLEAKERELRDFIRQFEQKMRESDKGIKELIWEKEKIEKERKQLVEALEKANEKNEQYKCEMEKEKIENSKLLAQLKELQGRFLLITGQQPTLTSTDTTENAVNLKPPQASVTPGSIGYVSLPPTPAITEQSSRISSDDMARLKHSTGSPFTGDFTPEEAAVLRRRPRPSQESTPNRRLSSKSKLLSRDEDGCTVCYEDVGSGIGASAQTTQQHLALLKRGRTSDRKEQDWYRKEGRPSSGGGAGSRLSRLFNFGAAAGRSKSKDEVLNKNKDLDEHDRSSSAFAVDAIAADLDLVEKADHLVQARQIPMTRWRQSHVLAWLELELGMFAYTTKFMDNVKSGKVLLSLTDYEIDSVLGIHSALHKKKLRMAIEEYRAPALCKFPAIKEVTSQYVCRQWLPSIGLAQYTPSFRQHLVDGRLLNSLNKKQLDKYMGVSRRFHQLSILKGIELFRLFNFDIKALSKRRMDCDRENSDLLVWTNARFGRWCEQADLGEYIDNLRESGIHGGFCVLDPSFTVDTLATALGVPTGRQMVRKHLAAEFLPLLNQARTQLDNEQPSKKGSGHRSGGSLGRAFSRSYTISGDQAFTSSPTNGAQEGLSSKRRRGLRGSIGRVFGLRVRRSTATTTCSNDDTVLNDEISPARSSTIANMGLHSRDYMESRNAGTNSNDLHPPNSATPANASSPKQLNRSTGTLSSTTSDLGSSIERSQHMKTILGTPKVLTQPPLTSMISLSKNNTVINGNSNAGGILKSSVSDTADLSRLQHLCLSPGEVLVNGGSVGGSRNPLVRLRNKTRYGGGDVPRMGLGASGAVDLLTNRSPGSAPARPHSVGDFGGLASYYLPNMHNNGGQPTVNGGGTGGVAEKRMTMFWWKSNGTKTNEPPADISFSPQKLQTWLSAEHFSSGGTSNGKENAENGVTKHANQNCQNQDQQRSTSNGPFGTNHAMGTISEQGEPFESESDTGSRECSHHSNCSRRGQGHQQEAGVKSGESQSHPRRHAGKKNNGNEEISPSRSSSSSVSPSRRDRPNSLPIRAKPGKRSSVNSQDKGSKKEPPMASTDSIHETDL